MGIMLSYLLYIFKILRTIIYYFLTIVRLYLPLYLGARKKLDCRKEINAINKMKMFLYNYTLQIEEIRNRGKHKAYIMRVIIFTIGQTLKY